jgi:hypothetical protein
MPYLTSALRTLISFNLIMPSTAANALFWDEFDTEFELIIAQISVNNASYWKTTHCDKLDMKRSPLRGYQKTLNLLNYNHSRRYQEQLRMPIDTFRDLIEFCLQNTELRSSKHVKIEEKVYIFIYIIRQLASNRYVQEEFSKSGETVHW